MFVHVQDQLQESISNIIYECLKAQAMIYSRKKITKAGEVFMTAKSQEERDAALKIINDWRSSHLFPLSSRKNALLSLMNRNNLQALISSQRLKRLTSIEYKLDLNPDMGLGGMQDIAGYRVVLKDVPDLLTLFNLVQGQQTPHRLLRITNYIEVPKLSGYRSIHFVFEYYSTQEKFDGLRIELQIRTKLQHNWATAVETVGLITNTSLKSSQGSELWLEFFRTVSSLFAIKEQLPVLEIHNAITMNDLMVKCYHLCEELNVIKTLRAIVVTIDKMTETKHLNHYYLLNIDFVAMNVKVLVYLQADLQDATEKYLALESTIDVNQNAVVLVSAMNLRALKKAYPSYFLDTSEFITALEGIQRNCVRRGLLK